MPTWYALYIQHINTVRARYMFLQQLVVITMLGKCTQQLSSAAMPTTSRCLILKKCVMATRVLTHVMAAALINNHTCPIEILRLLHSETRSIDCAEHTGSALVSSRLLLLCCEQT